MHYILCLWTPDLNEETTMDETSRRVTEDRSLSQDGQTCNRCCMDRTEQQIIVYKVTLTEYQNIWYPSWKTGVPCTGENQGTWWQMSFWNHIVDCNQGCTVTNVHMSMPLISTWAQSSTHWQLPIINVITFSSSHRQNRTFWHHEYKLSHTVRPRSLISS